MSAVALKVEALAHYLALKIGGKPCHHRGKARRALEGLERWYGEGAALELLQGKIQVRIEVRRLRWLTNRERTPKERAAVVLGTVSGHRGPDSWRGRYRPSILMIKDRRHNR